MQKIYSTATVKTEKLVYVVDNSFIVIIRNNFARFSSDRCINNLRLVDLGTCVCVHRNTTSRLVDTFPASPLPEPYRPLSSQWFLLIFTYESI